MAKQTSWTHKLHRWHHTPAGLLSFAGVELALGYAFGSLAIDSGSLWYYGIGIVCLVGTIQNLTKLILRLVRTSSKK